MRLDRHASAEDLARAAADAVAAVVRRRADARILLPAGATPVPLYRELVRRVGAGELDLGRAWLVQLDELAGVGPADARSFQAFLREHLLGPLGRGGERDLVLDGAAPDLDAEIRRHAHHLLGLGGADLALLGLGANGHVAFNEPGSRPEEGARRVALAEATRAGLAAAFAPGAPPSEGLTLGLAEILTAGSVVLIVGGARKSDALAALLSRPPGPELPASQLLAHEGLTILADVEALDVAEELS